MIDAFVTVVEARFEFVIVAPDPRTVTFDKIELLTVALLSVLLAIFESVVLPPFIVDVAIVDEAIIVSNSVLVVILAALVVALVNVLPEIIDPVLTLLPLTVEVSILDELTVLDAVIVLPLIVPKLIFELSILLPLIVEVAIVELVEVVFENVV